MNETHGATKRLRRLARAQWGIDLRGLDKRQQRRLMRRLGTGKGRRGWFVMIDEFALMQQDPSFKALWDLMPEREFCMLGHDEPYPSQRFHPQPWLKMSA